MYKTAYLFRSIIHIPNSLEQESKNNNEKDESSTDKEKNDVDNENANIDDSIRTHPGNKVSYCVHCKGKTFLNQESVDKHLSSKNHLKNVKKSKKNNEKAEEAKKRFIKRMDKIDKRIWKHMKLY